MNPAFLKQKPDRKDIESFKREFGNLLDKMNDRESEEFHKNLVIDFMNAVYYRNKHYINTKGRTDLVVHNGNDGIKTGLNEAFIIDGATKDALIKKSPKNAEVIRPILRGRDIKRYGYEFADRWLICTHNGTPTTIPPVNIDDYPDIKEHLDRFQPQLSDRQDKGVTPYNLRSCAYWNDFSKPKIVWIELTDHPNFALDLNGYYVNNTVFFITGEQLKYLTVFLNSKVCEWYFDKICATSGVGTRRWIKIYIDKIMIPKIDAGQEAVFDALFDSVSDYKRIDCNVERRINLEISKLFGFTDLELDHILNAVL